MSKLVRNFIYPFKKTSERFSLDAFLYYKHIKYVLWHMEIDDVEKWFIPATGKSLGASGEIPRA